MSKHLVVVLAVLLAGCGKPEDPAPSATPKPKPSAAATPKPESTTGKYSCLDCKLKTDAESCPKCHKSLVSAPTTAPAPTAAPTTGHSTPGKTAVAGSYACPVEGCTYTDPRAGTCLKHGDTKLKELWFDCAACATHEVAPGKCGKCGKDLARTLK